jgi:DNA-directed RNA polymerase specialized sigma24 family protein
MSHRSELASVALPDIAQRCAHETDRFFRRQAYDPRFCFELFCRAILDRCQRAWALVYTQYEPLVKSWIFQHSAFPSSGEELPSLVNRTFEKMWAALTPEKFNRFVELDALLRYLKMCVHSVLLDLARAAGRAGVQVELGDATVRDVATPSMETMVLERVQRQNLWRSVSVRLKNEKERQAIYGLYVLGLKPREVAAQHPCLFRTAGEVYRARENVIARLRRDSDLAEEFGPDT